MEKEKKYKAKNQVIKYELKQNMSNKEKEKKQ